jgi:hypothetical protein
MPDFIPGLKLSDAFYREAVRPVLDADFPGLRHAAAIIGSGSEVLGFDTSMSADHHWGPRVMLFLDETDHARYRDALHERLRHRLPYTFRGYPTSFSPPNPDDNGTQLLQAVESGPVNHRVEILTIRSLGDYLGIDPHADLEPSDWLTLPEQKLRSITAGAVYHDDIGLEAVRRKFAYYPHDVWLYLLAAGWTRIGQEEHLMGRAGYVGDELGSQIIAARLVHDLMRLCFLMERQYAPYPKWFGTAFAQLDSGPQLAPILRAALMADTWPEREQHLGRAYELAAARHNTLGITELLPATVSPFFGRPFQVIHGERFAAAIKARIQDERVKRIPTDIGGIDQFSDSTDLLENPGLRTRLRRLYE